LENNGVGCKWGGGRQGREENIGERLGKLLV